MRNVVTGVIISAGLAVFVCGCNNVNGPYTDPYPGAKGRCFTELPVGAVRPGGWLERTLRASADGITGHIQQYRPDAMRNTWDNRQYRQQHPYTPGNVRSAQWWPFEAQAYWADGLCQLACILEDDRLKGIADEFVDGVLAGQNADGYIGPWPDKPYSNEGDIYTQSLVSLALMSYHSATADSRIIGALHRAFKHIYANCRPVYDQQGLLPVAWRGGSYGWPSASHIIYPILRVYSKTGDQQLLRLAEMVYDAGQKITAGRRSDIQIQSLLLDGDTLYDMHGVDTTELLRIPAVYYLYSGNQDDLNASITGIEKVNRYHGQVHGCPVSDEQLRQAGAVNNTETCDQSTWSSTKQTMFAITGNVKYADGVEKIVFNAGPGSRRPDGKAIQYFSAPNQVSCTRRSGVERERKLFRPDGDPGVLCCVGESNRLYPNYVTGAMWLASADNGLAAICYGPCTVTAEVSPKARKVTVREKTNYPFEEKIRFVLESCEPVEFALYLRVPGWCSQASIQVNGRLYSQTPRPGKMVKIERLWSSGDCVELNVPMSVSLSRWNNSSVAVTRGPLVYSLKIKQQWAQVGERFVGFGDWQCSAGSDWNYALCLRLEGDRQKALIARSQPADSYFQVKYPEVPEDSCPWEYPPVELICKGKKVDGWQLLDADVTPDVPQSPVISNNPVENITLIPYGCAPVRITYFPIADYR